MLFISYVLQSEYLETFLITRPSLREIKRNHWMAGCKDRAISECYKSSFLQYFIILPIKTSPTSLYFTLTCIICTVILTRYACVTVKCLLNIPKKHNTRECDTKPATFYKFNPFCRPRICFDKHYRLQQTSTVSFNSYKFIVYSTSG